MLKDLRRANRKSTSYSKTAGWHDRDARRIESLETIGVEEQAIEFGTKMAHRLQTLAASLRGDAVEVNIQQEKVRYSVRVTAPRFGFNRWNGFGWVPGTYHYKNNLPQVRAAQRAAIEKGAKKRREIWQLIDRDQTKSESWLKGKFGHQFKID